MATRYACKTCGGESVRGVGYVVCDDTYRFGAPHPSCTQFHKGDEAALERYLSTKPDSTPPKETVAVLEWRDGASPLGFDASSSYVEMVWTSLLGPTAILSFRRLSIYARLSDTGSEVDVDELAQSLGVGVKVLERSLSRLVRYGFITWDAHTIRCRSTVGAVPSHLVGRLCGLARRYHDSFVGSHGHERAA